MKMSQEMLKSIFGEGFSEIKVINHDICMCYESWHWQIFGNYLRI